MRLAVVGCGYVSQHYLGTLPLHPELELVGATDRIAERARAFSRAAGVRSFRDLRELLDDESVELVVNLTNPASHYEVTRAALEAGKHVYSEKPLAMRFDDARELVDLAARRRLQLACAPSTLLGDTAQTLWRALRSGLIGPVRVVYAELDEGMVHRMNYRSWANAHGISWPYRDEFEVGCTIEHAAYYLTWLVAFFGPARNVNAFSSTQVPDKVPGEVLDAEAPDLSVACIEFASGVVARLTCSILAPHDHSLRVIGDNGVLWTDDCWDDRSPVYSRRLMTVRRRTFLSPRRTRHRLPRPRARLPRTGSASMDFCRGVAELANSVREGRPSRLPANLALHVNELTLAIHHGMRGTGTYHVATALEPLEPVIPGRLR